MSSTSTLTWVFAGLFVACGLPLARGDVIDSYEEKRQSAQPWLDGAGARA